MIEVVDVMRMHSRSFSEYLKSVNPIVLATTVGAFTFLATNIWHLHRDEIGIVKRIKTAFFSVFKSIPYVRAEIDRELRGVHRELKESLRLEAAEGQDVPAFIGEIPVSGMNSDEVVALATVYDNLEGPRYLDGCVSGAVFNNEKDDDEMKAYTEVFAKFAWSNPLWPKLFPGVRKMEAEVVRMCCNMMNGDDKTCGTMSTGGTISILLACMAHRNRSMKKGQKYPEMIVPASAHAAFYKAGEVFRIKVRKIPLNPQTMKVDLKKMRAAINSRTCMLVGSAPNFPYGTVDDIEAIGRMGLEFDIPVHVDACLGGFILPFYDHNIQYDFRVPGVSSISADTHKYGLTPKGSSVVLYRNTEYLHNQYFCDPDWQGGIYASATMEGSRAGVNIALCWTAMLYHGKKNYSANAEKVVATTRKIRNGLAAIPGIELRGDNDICIVSWTTTQDIDLCRFHNNMKLRNWQLGSLQFPSGIHIMVTLNHTHEGVAEKLIEDCQEAVEFVRNTPPTAEEEHSEAAIYGMAQGIPDRSIVNEFAFTYLDACYKDF